MHGADNMSEKIEIMGISVEKCYVEDVMESINELWDKDRLSTYGVITMSLLIAAQQDVELKEYIETLDKAVADEPEIVEAAGLCDQEWESDISEHGFFGTLFYLLNIYRNRIFLLGENQEDTEKFYNFLREKYPDIDIVGKDSLQEMEADQVDRVINEINTWNPQAVLSCSRIYQMERFVKRNRKKINTKVWFSLGSCLGIFRETGIKAAWLNRFLEKNNFKKLVSRYQEDKEKM